MERYIDVYNLVESLKSSVIFQDFGQDGYFIRDMVIDLVECQQTADVVPRAEVEQLKAIIDRLEREKAEMLVSETAEFRIPMEIAFRVRTEHPIVKAIKSEAAREIFADIESKVEIQLRLAEKNRTLFEQEGKNELAEEMSGRIYMLNTMKEYFASLKRKYGVTDNEREICSD